MAFLSSEEIDRIIQEKGLEKFTENTITDTSYLKKELQKFVNEVMLWIIWNMSQEYGVLPALSGIMLVK